MHRRVRIARSRTEACFGERRVRHVGGTGLLGLRRVDGQPHHARSGALPRMPRAAQPRSGCGVWDLCVWGNLGRISEIRLAPNAYKALEKALLDVSESA